jgi:uncharacterized membrane protein YfcA
MAIGQYAPVDAGIVAYVLIVVMVAVAAQAVVGFGFALITMPLLVLVLDVQTALVLATLISLSNTGVLAFTHRRAVPWATVAPMLVGAAAGMPVGLALLLLAPPDVIRLLVGVSTIVLATALVFGVSIGTRSVTSEIGIGLVSGVLNTSTGINGPPVVLYLQGRGHTPAEFRGGLATFFFGSSLVAIGGFTLSGIVSRDALLLYLLSLPVIAIASWVGHQAGDRVEPTLFRRLVLALLFLSALAAVASSISGLA